MKNRIVVSLLLFILSYYSSAFAIFPKKCGIESDSLLGQLGRCVSVMSQPESRKFTDSRIFQVTQIGMPIAAAAFALKENDTQYRALRNDYFPKFDHAYDDVLQYVPAFSMYGLKICGVEGRSSWPRMIVSNVLSAAVMVATVYPLKYLVREERPNRSAFNSFPSGHTAAAFASATMLHKEYGLTRSYWYSVFGYSAALTTAISRPLNNLHWVSDVLFGASMGIMSTEVGYWLADLLFKEKGLQRRERYFEPIGSDYRPSYVGFSLGYAFMNNSSKHITSDCIRLSTGATAFIDGAWFANRYWGIGGRFDVTSVQMLVNGMTLDESLDMKSVQIGPYVSYPLSGHWLVGANVLLGYTNVPSYDSNYQPCGRIDGMTESINAQFTYLPRPHFGMRLNAGYQLSPSISVGDSSLSGNRFLLSCSVNMMF